MQHRVAVILGTRPEAIKMAPVVQELHRHARFVPMVVSTGQHGELFDRALAEFGLAADVRLKIDRVDGSLAELTGSVLTATDELLRERAPHAVLVHGDTTTAMAAGLAAFYRRVPLVHVEAGLRSGNRWAPYPEEINRRTASLLADLHLAPTASARWNLLAEGVDAARIVVTGNTVVDAVRLTAGAAAAAHSGEGPLSAALDREPRKVLLFTLHRRESWGEPAHRAARAVSEAADRHPDMLVVACAHANPALATTLTAALGARDNVLWSGPQPYAAFLRLIGRAHLVVTDSGGVQEECASLGTPSLVLRETTERVEGVEQGMARLIGTDPARIGAGIDEAWAGAAAGRAAAAPHNPYGDGRAAARCAAAVARLLGGTDEPVREFRAAAGAGGSTR